MNRVSSPQGNWMFQEAAVPTLLSYQRGYNLMKFSLPVLIKNRLNLLAKSEIGKDITTQNLNCLME